MDRRVVAVVAFAVGAVAAASIVPIGAVAPAGADSPGGLAPQTTPEGFTDAEFAIRIYENGSARWTVRASRTLENSTEVARFRSFAETFEATETEAFENFKLRSERLVAFGTNATGREMGATGFAREARVVELGQTRGVVELSFLWTHFARTDGERVVVGDVFQGGMFVDDGQRLVLARGPDLAFESVAPPPDSRAVEDNLTASETVTWLGKRDFPDRRPRAVLAPVELATGGPQSPADGETGGDTATPADGTPTEAPGTESDGGGIGILPFVVAVVVLLGLGGGFALYSGAIGGVRSRSRSGAGSTEAGATDAETESESGPGATAATAQTAVPDEELLSDEDRVMALLEQNGGRMKQVNIVEETDWSKSKVSMLLSEMEEEGAISKLRVGRENIVSKTGEEPEAAGSPFEDE